MMLQGDNFDVIASSCQPASQGSMLGTQCPGMHHMPSDLSCVSITSDWLVAQVIGRPGGAPQSQPEPHIHPRPQLHPQPQPLPLPQPQPQQEHEQQQQQAPARFHYAFPERLQRAVILRRRARFTLEVDVGGQPAAVLLPHDRQEPGRQLPRRRAGGLVAF